MFRGNARLRSTIASLTLLSMQWIRSFTSLRCWVAGSFGLVGGALLGACAGSPAASTITDTTIADETGAGHSSTSGALTGATGQVATTGPDETRGDAGTAPDISGSDGAGGTSNPVSTGPESGGSSGSTDTADAGSTGSTGGGGDGECGCLPQWPAGGPVQGETPIGALAFPYAAYDPDGCGGIGSIDVYLYPEMPVLDGVMAPAANPVRLEVALTGPGWPGNWVSEGPVHVRLVDKDEASLAEADGILDVSQLDIADARYWYDCGQPHLLVGELHVDAPGWALHGGFTAAMCWMIEGITICR